MRPGIAARPQPRIASTGELDGGLGACCPALVQLSLHLSDLFVRLRLDARHMIARALHMGDDLVELDLKSRGVLVLGVLQGEHHEQGRDADRQGRDTDPDER